MSGIRRRILAGLGAGGSAQFVNVLIQLVSVPLFLGHWGVQLYGEWLVLSTIPAYLAMSDLGFSSVAGNKIGMQLGAQDLSGARTTFQSAWALVTLASLAAACCAIGVCLLPVSDFLNIQLTSPENVTRSLILFACTASTTLQTSLFAATLRASGANALSIWLGTSSRILEITLTAAALMFGAGLVAVAATILGARVVCLGITALITSRRLVWLQLGLRQCEWSLVRTLLRPSIAFLSFPMGNALKNQGMLAVVAATLGPSAVVTYSTARTVINSVQQAMGIVNASVWPEISRAVGSGDIYLARKIHRIACKFSLWISFGFLGGLALVGPHIVLLWTHGRVRVDASFFDAMLMTMLVSTFWFTSSVALMATNKHTTIALQFVGCSMLSLGFAFYFVGDWGLLGVAMGSWIAELIMVMCVLRASLAFLEDTVCGYCGYVLNPFLRRYV
jgi:O-antigen/teichoic acid export membrane protein